MSSVEADAEVSHWLDALSELGQRRAQLSPDAFLTELEQAQAELQRLRAFRKDALLMERFLRYGQARFSLVDSGDEYAQAGDEVVLLALAVGPHSSLMASTLKDAIVQLSGVLAEPGVVPVFSQLLKRAKHTALQSSDTDLNLWVGGMVSVLPS